MKNYAIIGFGCAGFSAARGIRKVDPEGRICVFNDTNEPPFCPMLTTYYAAEKIRPDAVFPFGDLKSIEEQLRLEIFSDTSVSKVKADDKTVILSDGREMQFDSILIATGASALVPGSLAKARDSFLLMRTLEDARKLKEYIDTKPIKKATVIGASMVGIKVAEVLFDRGVETTLVDGASYLFPLAAYKDTALDIQKRLEDKGVKFIFDAQVVDIDEGVVKLADGRSLETELLCLCIGTRTNVQLVANTDVVEGESVKVNRGIVVDEHMRTNVPGIYAAGDCCEGCNLQTGETAIIGLWANAGAQGECAGRNMAGGDEVYYGNILHNITHFFGMDFIGLGDVRIPGKYYEFDAPEYKVGAVVDNGKLNSINIFGNYKISGILKNHLTKRLLGSQSTLTTAQRGILIKQGLSNQFLDVLEGKE
ncbi:MAG: FAD-dependent oxidoreductase [Lachnospiraceae bacterium]|nr:FAD-dependent oxidoreductase [Lachnospiraceae bacterium]